jgi:hypothetical protein
LTSAEIIEETSYLPEGDCRIEVINPRLLRQSDRLDEVGLDGMDDRVCGRCVKILDRANGALLID